MKLFGMEPVATCRGDAATSNAEFIAELDIAFEILRRRTVFAEPRHVELVELSMAHDSQRSQRVVDARAGIRRALLPFEGTRPLVADSSEVFRHEKSERRFLGARQLVNH